MNGRRDLLDFTPVWIDISDVVENLPDTILDELTFRIRQEDGAVNAVWTDLAPSEAGSFQTEALASGFGPELSSAPQNAEAVRITSSGTELPDDFLELAGSDGGVFLVEGRATTSKPLWFEGVYDGRIVCSNRLDMSISSVEDMYRWLNLRGVCGDGSGGASKTGSPENRPDGECDGRNYVFVHGFNVNSEEARASAAEVFKRLWQSGLKSMFTAVTWYGDQEQFTDPVRGTVSMNYYANALHAFETAPSLAHSCNYDLPGRKVMIAHSLGNMLVSSAAVDHLLAYDRYYMLNAAVAMEAYDASEQAGDMIDPGWTSVPSGYWASRWHGLFGPDDFRSSLSWKGRFAGIRNAVNCYSESEDIVGNPKDPAVSLSWTDWALQQSSWVMQEALKGASVLDGINILPGSHIGCEGGWGRSAHYPLWCATGSMLGISDLTREDVIRHPLFTPFRNEQERMASTNLFTFADADATPNLRARFLADAIPAESHAAGANAFDARANIVNRRMDTSGGYMANYDKWPERDGRKNPIWSHSAFKQVAYFFTYKLFDYLTKGKLE